MLRFACYKNLKLTQSTFGFQFAGLKNFLPLEEYNDVEKAERPKLSVLGKVPQYPPNLRPPKMQKKLRLMRGPEVFHNTLLHKQYGIIARGGGRLNWGHLEMMRLTIGRKMDTNRMFAIWRIPAPWQPVTRKGQGQRMGGGKGAIDHYVTPIKSGRIILEIAGKCDFVEVKPFLAQVCNQLPFKAEVISEDAIPHYNKNFPSESAYSFKYIVQNNLSSCHRWLSPFDHKWFGQHF